MRRRLCPRYSASASACSMSAPGWQPRSGDLARPEVLHQQALDERRIELDARLRAVVPEDLHEVRVRRALGEHLVLDAAEERLVHQFRRLEVGGEHDEHDERQLELLARSAASGSRRGSRAARSSGSGGRAAEQCWRPKSSMTSTPPLAMAWTGAR